MPRKDRVSRHHRFRPPSHPPDLPEAGGDWFSAADAEHIRREKAKARELRRSQWWKNRIASGVCHYCKRAFPPSELTMDHVVPIVRGGRTTRRNVVPCCRECNATKQHRLPVEWKEQDILRNHTGDAPANNPPDPEPGPPETTT